MIEQAATGNGTAERILGAAQGLLAQEGAEAVTMRRVARSVGITAMAVYRHFPNHEGLLQAVTDAGFRDFAERLGRLSSAGTLDERLTRILDQWVDFALENPPLFELMFLRRRAGARRFPEDFRAGLSPTANVLAAVIEKGMQDGQLREDDAWEITFETGALLQGLLMLYLGGRISGTDAEFRALCHRSFRRYFDGIRA